MSQLSDDLDAFLELPDEGDPFNPEKWPADMAFRDDLLNIDGPLLREHVFAAFEESDHKGAVFALVWGFPAGHTSFKNAKTPPNLRTAIADPKLLLDSLHDVRYLSTTALKTIRKLNRTPGINTAATSKVAYFAKVETVTGNCLIFDKQVTRAIMNLAYPELLPLRPAIWSSYVGAPPSDEELDEIVGRAANYQSYMDGMYAVTRALGARFEAADLERFLFRRGQAIGAAAGQARRQATIKAKKQAKVV